MLGDGAAEQKFERRGEPAGAIWQAAIPRLKISMMIGMTNLAFNERFVFFPFATPPQSLRKRLFRHQTCLMEPPAHVARKRLARAG